MPLHSRQGDRVRLHLKNKTKQSRTGKSIETGRLVVARSWGRGVGLTAAGDRVFFEGGRNVLQLDRGAATEHRLYEMPLNCAL